VSVIRIDSARLRSRWAVPFRAYPREQLTARDVQILDAIVADPSATRRQIGAGLAISENSVKLHLKRAYRLLGAETRAQVYALWSERQAAQRRAA
jgi:DNA-binding CsgD family transcriptional regulator